MCAGVSKSGRSDAKAACTRSARGAVERSWSWTRTRGGINRLGVITINLSLDDRLWFAGPIRGGRPTGTIQLTRAFDLNLTNAADSVVKYLTEGGLAMFWPEGANSSHFRPLDLPFLHDVS